MDYYEKYAGSASGETLLSLDKDIVRAQEMIDMLVSNNDDLYEIEAWQRTIDGIEYLETEVSNMITYNGSGEHDREILLTPPYYFLGLFGRGAYEFQNNSGLLATLFMSLFLAGMFAYERQSKYDKASLFLAKRQTTLVPQKTGCDLALCCPCI